MSESRHEVIVYRGDVPESRHVVHVAVVDSDGVMRRRAGDASFLTFARSAVKPVQAQPLIDDGGADAFGLTDEEIALTCASHSGQPEHVALARSILGKIDIPESALACGPHMPFDDASADALRAAGEEPGRVHNNCSGKHAGMLALARHNGWATEGYHRLEHPVQQRMLSEMSQWCDVRIGDIATGVDGCGVVTFGLPLNGLALMFSRLALASSLGVGAAARAVNAMRAHPMLVAGRKRLCTALMETTAGGVFAKVGAEGVYCAGVPSMGIGVALKVEDGALRAAEPALLAVLTTLGVLGDVENSALSRWSAPSVRNTRREDVGRIESHIELETV